MVQLARYLMKSQMLLSNSSEGLKISFVKIKFNAHQLSLKEIFDNEKWTFSDFFCSLLYFQLFYDYTEYYKIEIIDPDQLGRISMQTVELIQMILFPYLRTLLQA